MKRKEPDPRKINSRNAYRFIHEDNYVDRGVDSIVYRFRNYVVQWFTKTPPDRVRMLRQVTDGAAGFVDGRTVNLGIRGKATLRIERIQKMVVTQNYGEPVVVKRYVGGHRPKEGEIKPLDRALQKLSHETNEHLGVQGIEFFAPNTKLQKMNRGIGPWAKYTCTITDVCRYLNDLAKK